MSGGAVPLMFALSWLAGTSTKHALSNDVTFERVFGVEPDPEEDVDPEVLNFPPGTLKKLP